MADADGIEECDACGDPEACGAASRCMEYDVPLVSPPASAQCEVSAADGAGVAYRVPAVEGMVTVWDHDGRYVGCMGRERYQRLLDEDMAELEALRAKDNCCKPGDGEE